MVSLRAVVIVSLLGLPLNANAALFTGDPSADGWTNQGNSLASGVYIRGSGGLSFDLYSTATIWSSTDYGWLVGDTVLGIGGEFVGTNSNLTTSGANNETSARLVAKFGTSTSEFAAASPGPAQGSMSAGHGGDGSILVAIDPYTALAEGAGTATDPDLLQRYVGGVATTITGAGDFTQLMYTWDAIGNKLASFEYLLNTSALARAGYTLLPQLGDQFVMTVQRGTSSTLFTDALGELPSAVSAPVVPLPGTFALFAMGSLGLGVAGRRRRVSTAA